MDCSIDLRYGIPPLIYLILLLFPNSKSISWNQLGAALETNHHTTLMMLILLLAIAILFVLFTSIKLLLSVSARSIRLRAGDFSVTVFISLLASFIFSPSLFWFAYALIICTSPWHGLLWNLFKHFLCWLCDTLQAIPTLIITCTTRQHETLQPEHPEAEINVPDVEAQLSVVIDEQQLQE